MLPRYHQRDEFIDYEIVSYDKSIIRGPIPENNYFCCLGSAFTFGRYTTNPYPSLLSKLLDIPVLNLAGGAFAPQTYLEDFPNRIDAANKSLFVILQIMSARFSSNSKYTYAFEKPSKNIWQENLASKDINQLVEESRQNYIVDTQKLLKKIKVPIIALYFSKRDPDYKETNQSLTSLFGNFPQLVNEETLNKATAGYPLVKVVSSKGLPQKLPNGEINNYYPSSQMHQLVAATLQKKLVALNIV